MIRRRKFQAKPVLQIKTERAPASSGNANNVEQAIEECDSGVSQRDYNEANGPKPTPASNSSSSEDLCTNLAVLDSDVLACQDASQPSHAINSDSNVFIGEPVALTDGKSSEEWEYNFSQRDSVKIGEPIEDDDASIPTAASKSISSEMMTPVHKIVIDEDEDDLDVVNGSLAMPTSSSISVVESCQENIDDIKISKRRRISALRHESVIDPKRFTLADLVDWRPRTENTLRKKWAERRQQALENEATRGGASSAAPTNEHKTEPKFVGPRVRIDEHGQMVIDEQSLVVTNEVDINICETVDDDMLPKKLNSMSFRKKSRVYSNWTVWETDLFYEALCATGTDFSLMHEFIPSRTRAELKRKFNREERSDPERVDEVLHNPTILDETFRERIEILKQRVDEKLAEKCAQRNKKKPIRARRGRPPKVLRDNDNNNEEGEEEEMRVL